MKKKKIIENNVTIAVYFPVVPRFFTIILKMSIMIKINDLFNATTRSELLSDNFLHLKSGAACSVEKLFTDRIKKLKKNHNKTNLLRSEMKKKIIQKIAETFHFDLPREKRAKSF